MAKKIIKGKDLMLFDSKSVSYAFATNHTLTITAETTDVTTKDHGTAGVSMVSKYTWEITSENLFTTTTFDDMFDKMVIGEKIRVCFGRKVDVGDSTVADGDLENWGLDDSEYYLGDVLITSLTANSNNGENATMSVTLTGCGRIKSAYNWVDVSNLIPNLKLEITSDGIVTDWSFDDASVTNLSKDSNFYNKGNFVVWRNAKSNNSISCVVPITESGYYWFSIDKYDAYESDYTVERKYSTCKIEILNSADKITSTIEFAPEVTDASIMRGKTATQLTEDDNKVDVNGVTYYVPNWNSEYSVNSYFEKGNYNWSRKLQISKGSKLKITIGQTHGGTKTHSVFSLPKLQYIKKRYNYYGTTNY